MSTSPVAKPDRVDEVNLDRETKNRVFYAVETSTGRKAIVVYRVHEVYVHIPPELSAAGFELKICGTIIIIDQVCCGGIGDVSFVIYNLYLILSRAKRKSGAGEETSGRQLTPGFRGQASRCWQHQSDFRFKKVGVLSRGLSHDRLTLNLINFDLNVLNKNYGVYTHRRSAAMIVDNLGTPIQFCHKCELHELLPKSLDSHVTLLHN